MFHEPRLTERTNVLAVDHDARALTLLLQGFGDAQKGEKMLDEALQRRMPHSSFPERYLKAAVGATTGTANPLHLQAGLARAFLDRVAAGGLRARVPWVPLPANVFAPIASTTATATFVGGSAPIPVARLDFDTVYIGMGKIALICVFPLELLRSTDDRATSLIERHLGRVVMEGEDEELLSDTAAVEGERPAGLLFGKSPIAAGSPESLAADIELLFAETRGGAPNRPWFILSARAALYLSLLRGADGPMFPDVGVNGGNIGGVPVAISKAAGSKLILVDADAVGLWDGGMLIDRSIHSALEMDGAPPGSAGNRVSLFQTNSMAVRLIRLLDWAVAFDDAVNYITLPVIAGSPS